MFKIGEFSKLAQVSARMLRYYDQCGLLCPDETDRFTSYRLYSAAQLPALHRIVALRDMGFGVEEIKAVLPRFDDTAFLQEALSCKAQEVEQSIASEQHKLANIAALCGQLRKEINMIYDVELKSLPAEPVLSLREVIPAYDQEGLLWEKLCQFMMENSILGGTTGYSIYHDDEYKESDVDVEIAVPVTAFGENSGAFAFKELPAIPQAATVRFSGPYEGYSEAIAKLAAWIEQNGYAFDGLVRGLAIVAPGPGIAPENYLTELQVPIRKA